MLSCSIWFSAPSLWMDGSLESRCVGSVYGADGAVRGTVHSVTDCQYCSKFSIYYLNVTASPHVIYVLFYNYVQLVWAG